MKVNTNTGSGETRGLSHYYIFRNSGLKTPDERSPMLVTCVYTIRIHLPKFVNASKLGLLHPGQANMKDYRLNLLDTIERYRGPITFRVMGCVLEGDNPHIVVKAIIEDKPYSKDWARAIRQRVESIVEDMVDVFRQMLIRAIESRPEISGRAQTYKGYYCVNGRIRFCPSSPRGGRY